MGLDMYLFEVPKEFAGDPYLPEEELALIPKEQRVYRHKWEEPYPRDGDFYHRPGVREMAYWRKVNAIHQWFVENVQGGEDECNPHRVTTAQLRVLADLVETALTTPARAASLLPTASGFFFGSTEYDEYYFQDLKETQQMLEKALAEHREGTDLVYLSSW